MPRPREVYTFAWRDLSCQVDHIPDWKIEGWSKLIIRVVHPRGAPLPFAEGGYLVHGLDEDHLIAAGGVVRFMLSWMDRDASLPRYAHALYIWKQRDLFR